MLFSHKPESLHGNDRIRSYEQNVLPHPVSRWPVLHDSYPLHPLSYKQLRLLHADSLDRSGQSYDMELQ